MRATCARSTWISSGILLFLAFVFVTTLAFSTRFPQISQRYHSFYESTSRLIKGDSASGVSTTTSPNLRPSDGWSSEETDEDSSYHRPDTYCDTFPDPGNIVVSVKTGATESQNLVPAALTTFLRCIDDPLIFSDLDQTLGRYRFHDVLASFSPTVMEANPEFDIYRSLQKLAVQGSTSQAPGVNSDRAAQALDKYKFLHIIERSWELAPDKDWYFYIEADTYLSWPTLLAWLPRLDPNKKSYFGYPVEYRRSPESLWFAHGGAGFLLSGAAVRDISVARQGLANRWDHRIHDLKHGDYVVASALEEELGIFLSNGTGTLNAKEPDVASFSLDSWCRPVVTLHSLGPDWFNKLYQYERDHPVSNFLMKDLFVASMPHKFDSRRSNWDNLAGDDEASALALDFANNVDEIADVEEASSLRDPHRRLRACELACEQTPACLQFMFRSKLQGSFEDEDGMESACHLSKAISLGRPRGPDFNPSKLERKHTSWTSGWMNDRIAEWVEEHRDCSQAENALWPT